MKLKLKTATLAAAVGQCLRAVERKATISILTHLLLRAGADGRVEITASDLDMELRATLAAEVEAPGCLAIPAHTLSDILRRLPGDGDLALEADERRLTLRAGRSRLVLNCLDPADFPSFGDFAATHHFALPAADLARLFAKTEFAISTEETRYYLNGVFLHAVAGDGAARLAMVSTDGHRLALARCAAPDGAAGMPGIIVPRKAVAELRRLAEAGGGDLALSLSTGKLVVEGAGLRVATKLIDGSFPDYQRVVPANPQARFAVDAGELAAATDLAGAITDSRRGVKFAFGPERLVISSANSDQGEARGELAADGDGAVEIGFNPRYLLALLAAMKADTVIVKLTDPGSPALFQPQAGGDELYVLMPMRV